MTTFQPRAPYSSDELVHLYHPQQLDLKHVQVILRHGERTPVTPRFQNAGLPAYWPYCNAAKHLRSVVMTTKDWSNFDQLQYKRQVETFDKNDFPMLASGPGGETDNICNMGELTDKGRETTLALGERLRHLYVEQLGFMPSNLSDASSLYIRATPIPRALESVQQAFQGLYPPNTRDPSLPPPTIVARSPQDETLYPNEPACKRFGQLAAAFAQRAAGRWNDSPEMDYINSKIGKWMPEGSPKAGVDSHPRLSGIMDTINATLGHGPATRLPSEFYDAKVREYIDKIVVDEWFAGYSESEEYRTLGTGGLVRDMVARMVDHSTFQNKDVRFCLSGAHDTTMASVVASLGAYDKEPWPPFTSHIAMELFQKKGATSPPPPSGFRIPFFSFSGAPEPLSKQHVSNMKPADKQRLNDWYVRVRYNDRPITVPGCRPAGKHLDGDESFCTLEAFKEITDKFAPQNWKSQCRQNLGKSAFPETVQPAGV